MRGVTTDDIDYYGHRIDERSQIIIQLLRDMTEATAGKLRNEAGLDDTSKVHYRVEKHLGPTAACLVEQVGTEPRPGDQSDEVVYGLTDQGLDFAVAHDNELTDAVAAAEAVETLRRIRATVDGFEQRVSEVENSVENMDEWKNRWSTRVGRVENDVDGLESGLDGKADAAWVEDTFDQHESWSAKRREEIDEVSERVDKVDQRLNGIDQRLEEISEELDDRPTRNEMRVGFDRLQDSLEEQIEDVRETAERMFGGRF